MNEKTSAKKMLLYNRLLCFKLRLVGVLKKKIQMKIIDDAWQKFKKIDII